MKQTIEDLARGRWFDVHSSLGGIDSSFLTDKHGPCPNCGGKDRFRWDDTDGSGSCFCSQCGGKDQRGGGMSGIDLLMRVRGWDFKRATAEIKSFLGDGGVLAETEPRPIGAAKPFRQAEMPPAGVAPPRKGKRTTAQHAYTNDAGRVLFYVQRVEREEGGKYFMLTVWLDGKWHTVRKADEFLADWPEPRPLYRLHPLVSRPDATVVISEGEKAVDATAELLEAGGEFVAIGFRNGAKAANKADWRPCAGRRVILAPDADKDGDEFVIRTAAELRKAGAVEIRVAWPPEGTPKGWDLADARDDDGWQQIDAEMHLSWAVPIEEALGQIEARRVGEVEQQMGLPTEGGSVGVGKRDLEPLKWERFTMLGYDNGRYYYHPHGTAQVTGLKKSDHSPSTLLDLVPDRGWWMDHWPKYNKDGELIGIDWQGAMVDLFAAQQRIGVFDPKRIRGCGAWWDSGRSVAHLGDRLLIDGEEQDVRGGPAGSRFIYQKCRSVETLEDLSGPITAVQGSEFLGLLERFNWEQPSAAMLVAGWLLLAPICGSLNWRPHLWLTAASGSGKSTLLGIFVALLSGFLVEPLSSSSEAGIRQQLQSSALPVLFDEAESNKKADQVRIQGILELARASSSESTGSILKGTTAGEGLSYLIRSCFLFCSVATALKEGADKTRFTVVTLVKPTSLMTAAQASAQWKSLQRGIADMITPEFCRGFVARAFRSAGLVRDSVPVFKDVAGERLGNQRLGDQYGTLCAGAWALTHDTPPTKEEAEFWLQMHPLDAFVEDQRTESDEKTCLETLLEHQIRVEVEGSGSHTRTVLELIRITQGLAPEGPKEPVWPGVAKAALGRYGIKVDEAQGALVVSNTAKAIRNTVLRDTPWQNCWPAMLLRVDGAKRASAPVRFLQLGISRAVLVPLQAIDG